ncbi:unnamed protein product [Rotaria socialis]
MCNLRTTENRAILQKSPVLEKASNNFYLNIHYDEKINPTSDQQLTPDVIIASLSQRLSSTITTNLELFLLKIKAEYEYSPFGEQLLGYELTGHESSYFIHRINQQNLPNKTRPQICEMLILPPYQRKGHGRRLLTAIYEDLRTNSRVQDIKAEDPSDEFVALRDLVSLELCHKYLPDLFSKESILKTDRVTKEMIDKAREVLN